jgi:hypothetical protein
MKFLISLIIYLVPVLPIQAQVNYVLNPGLEKYDSCPHFADQIRYAVPWSALDTINSIAPGRPEYCNVCDTGASYGAYGVPKGIYYYHYPHSGNGMAEVYMFGDSSMLGNYQRDYLQGKLYKSLTSGKSYCVTFYVTLAQYGAMYAVNHIAAYLDDGHIDTTVNPGLPQTEYIPNLQVDDTAIINDTLHWIKIEGSFTANGTEKFITIGNFHDVANTAHLLVNPNAVGGGTIYLVDDISVIESNHVAFAGNDTTVSVGDSVFLGEIALPYTWYKLSGSTLSLIDSASGGVWVHPALGSNKYVVKQTLCGAVSWDTVVVNAWPVGVAPSGSPQGGVKVWPDPFTDQLQIEHSKIGSVIRIYDITGRLLYSIQPMQERCAIDTKNFSKGVYFIEIADTKGNRTVQKVVKQ